MEYLNFTQLNIDKDIFKKEDLNDIFSVILVNHFPEYDETNLDNLDAVSKTFVLIANLDAQIQNGGAIQFIDNASGNYFQETIEAAQTIECEELTLFLDKVAHQFTENKIPKDWEERRDLFDELNEFNSTSVTFDDLDESTKARVLANHDGSIPLNEIVFETENEWVQIWENLDDWYYDNYTIVYESLINYLKSNAKLI